MHGVISAGRADEAFAGAENAPHRLSHLAQLEAESIYIMREAVAEFRKSGDALFHRQGFRRCCCIWR